MKYPILQHLATAAVLNVGHNLEIEGSLTATACGSVEALISRTRFKVKVIVTAILEEELDHE